MKKEWDTSCKEKKTFKRRI